MSSNARPIEPPYRIELRPWGIGEPHQRPVSAFKVRPGGQVDTAMPDEVALWRYVEYLESQRLSPGVSDDTADDTACEATKECAAVALAPNEQDTEQHFGGPQARAQAANVPDAAEITTDAPERALREAGANGGLLEMPTDDASADVERGPTLRERVVSALLADPTRTNGAIAEECGCSDELVRQRRKELENESKLQLVAVRRSDGTLYSRAGSE